MAIEFRCTQCNRLLRTGDETAGKQAKCPQCGTILPIPVISAPTARARPAASGGPVPAAPTSSNPFGGSGRGQQPLSGPESLNPYRAPLASDLPPAAAAAAGAWAPTQIDIGDVLGRAWRIYQDKLGLCVLTLGLSFLLSFVVYVGVSLCNNLLIAGVVGAAGNASAGVLLLLLLAIPVFLLVMAVETWLQFGMLIFAMKVARGQEASLNDIFSGGRFLVRGILAALLYVLFVFGILAVCLIPAGLIGLISGNGNAAGIFALIGYVVALVTVYMLILTFSQFPALVIDRDLGVMDAFRVSMQITKGNRLSLFVISLVLSLLNFAGALACGVGIFFTMPFIILTFAVTYLAMTGQPTADQRVLGMR